MTQYLLFWLAKNAIEWLLAIALLVLGYGVAWILFQQEKRSDQAKILKEVKRRLPLNKAEEKQVSRHIWRRLPLTKGCYSVSFDVATAGAIEFARQIQDEQP